MTKSATAAYVSAKARYTALQSARSQAESRAKTCAALTLPKLWKQPGQKSESASSRKTPYQGTGARCVNSLAARFQVTLLPPNGNAFKLSPDGIDIAKIEQQAGIQQGEIEEGLAEIERQVTNEIETSGMRGPIGEALKHAVATGNFCLYVPDDGPAKTYPLSRYMIDRDGMGNLLEVVTLDSVSIDTLEDATLAAVDLKRPEGTNGPSEQVDLYTRVLRQEQLWIVVQEINGHPVPGSDGSYPIDSCPWIPVSVGPEFGSAYGVGLVWDYIGDFKSLESLRKAILKASSAAAKVLWALDPNSAIRDKQITEAESGAVLRMRATELQAIQLGNKMGDLQFARSEAQEIVQHLERVFGVRTSVQRQGERVTAEEIRYMAQELEDSLGNVYSTMADAFLLPLIRRLLDRMTKAHKLPQLPAGIVKPRITVGMAAIGRGQDMQKLITWAQATVQVIGEQQFAARTNVGELMARMGAAANISLKGLVKTDEEMQQDQQQETMNNAAVRAAPQLAQAATQPQEAQQ